MNTLFISDTHFGHNNIIKYCNRPFNSTEEMDERMVTNWNNKVRPGDTVYHLGDIVMFFRDAKRILPELNGNIRLVVGNHDDIKALAGLGRIQRFYESKKVKDLNLLLTHRPTYMGVEPSMYNVHGHIHDLQSPTHNHINISVEQIDYTPITYDELHDMVLMKHRENEV